MKKTILTVALILLITALLLIIAFKGLSIGSFHIPSVSEGISLGLDLVGGSEIVYEAQIPEGTDSGAVSSGMETAQAMLRQRLNTLGFTEANVYLSGSQRIVVEIPNVDDPEEAVQMLGSTALIQFVDYNGEVILEGDDVESATASYGPVDDSGISRYHVSLNLSEAGYQKFKSATSKIAAYTNGNNYLEIMMDGETISKPFIESRYAGIGIDTSSPIITLGSDDSVDYAKYLADIISAGHMPFALEEAKLQAVSATLGEKALETSIFAGIIGIALVMLYMLIVYRLPGLIADLALLLYMSLFLFIMSVTHLNLSLPGIAGIILTVGMAVDANIIIYERLREELQSGKTLRSSVNAGFKRAFSAIIDSNVTTIIAAAVLLWLGTGTILGFAKTLMIGVILSMLCMLIVPNLILKSMTDIRFKSLRPFGLTERGNGNV